MMDEQKNSILCPSCRRLISRDEARCPYCGAGHPGRMAGVKRWLYKFESPEGWIRGVIALNIGIYIISLVLKGQSLQISLNIFSTLSPDSLSLQLLGATGTLPIIRNHNWWSLVTANFLHGNLLHIFFNMVVLKQIAPLVLREYGVYRTTVIYLIGGVIGFFVSFLAGVVFTIGASAAICSLVGSLLYFGWSRGGLYGQILFKQLGVWVISLIVIGFLFPMINNWGHGGGIVAGAALGFLLGYKEKRPEGRFNRMLGAFCAIATIGILVITVVSGVSARFLPGIS